MMRILGNRVLLSPLPVQERSAGGIVLPQSQVGDKKMWWRIDQLGTGKPGKNGVNPMDGLRVGQSVCTPLYFDHTSLEDGSERKIVSVDQLVAVLEWSNRRQRRGGNENPSPIKTVRVHQDR